MAEWFYRFNGTEQGPLSEQDLRHVFESGALPWTTPIWRDGMDGWKKAGLCLGTNSESNKNKRASETSVQPIRVIPWKKMLVGSTVVIGAFVAISTTIINQSSKLSLPSSSSFSAEDQHTKSTHLFDEEDRDRIRKGQIPGLVLAAGKNAGLTELEIMEVVQSAQMEVRARRLNYSDDQLYEMVYHSIIKAKVARGMLGN